jgi:hypothetical protein
MPEQRFVLPRGKPTGKLDTRFLEELCGIDIREPFKAAAHNP